MSDSDDTDYLLLIPPNFFLVHSDNEEDLAKSQPAVDRELVDDLVSHVTSLENRVSAIESFENSLAAEIEGFTTFSSPRSFKLSSLPCNKRNKEEDVFNWVSSNFDESRDYDEVESIRGLRSNFSKYNNFTTKDKEESLKDRFEMSSPLKEYRLDSRDVPPPRMDLTEVDRLLQEMEVTQRDIENKLRLKEKEFNVPDDSNVNREKARSIPLQGDTIGSVPDLGFGVRQMFSDNSNKQSPVKSPSKAPVVEPPFLRRSVSLLGASNGDDNDKYKSYISHDYNSVPSRSFDYAGKSNDRITIPSVRRKLSMVSQDSAFKTDTPYSEKLASPLKSVAGSPSAVETRFKSSVTSPSESNQSNRTVINVGDRGAGDNVQHASGLILNRRVESFPPHPPLVTEKLLSLNELWKSDDDVTSRNPVKLKQKLEEEKYRRLHLENTVQALQKKVLEDQEKLAVAIQVDEKKDLVIEKVTDAWKKMVDHWKQIEEQRHEASQALLAEKAMSKKSHEEINKRVVRWEREVSQALDLAAGFKSKAEVLERELSSAKEESTQKFQEYEGRIADVELSCKQKEKECRHLEERLEESLDQLHEERKICNELKIDLAKLEETYNRCDAELSVIKEQRDLLSLRLKEETSRIKILDQQKLSLESSLSEASAKQKEAEESCKSAKKQLETVKSDLKSLYQSQLESVVREKLAEFQSQLETARDDMRHQLDAELSAARESSRRHQQTLVNSHVAEMRRLESIHKEEMASLERRLAEAESRSTKLEMAKRDIAHKLHKVMQNQWQQALGIITGDLTLRQGESEFEAGGQHGIDLSQTMDHENPCKEVPIQPAPQISNQNQLLKYIEMMLDKHPGRPVDTLDSSALHDSSELFDESMLQPLNWNDRLRPGVPGNEMRNEVDKETKKPPWK